MTHRLKEAGPNLPGAPGFPPHLFPKKGLFTLSPFPARYTFSISNLISDLSQRFRQNCNQLF